MKSGHVKKTPRGFWGVLPGGFASALGSPDCACRLGFLAPPATKEGRWMSDELGAATRAAEMIGLA